MLATLSMSAEVPQATQTAESKRCAQVLTGSMPKQTTSLSTVQPKLPNPDSFDCFPLSGKHFCT